MLLTDIKDKYIRSKRCVGVSDRTIEYYSSTVDLFISFVGDVDISVLTDDHIEDFILYLQAQDSLNSVSVQTYCRGVRCFISWMVKKHYCDVSLYINFKLPKAIQKEPLVLTEEEQKRLLSCFDLDRVLDLRDFLICSMMFGMGLRRGEVVRLIPRYVFPDYAIVHGKGNKERYVPVPANLYPLLSRYVSMTGNADHLFCKRDGSPVSATTVKDMFNRLKKKSGITRLCPHLLRHTFGTFYYDNGGSIYNLAQILGHSSVKITERYMHLGKRTIMRDFDRFSPLHI